MRYRTILIPVLNRFRVTTFGNDFSASRAYIDLDVPEFTAILPYTEELQLHTVGESMTNNLKWGLYVQPGFDRDRELGGGPFLIGAVVDSGTSGPLRHTAYTDTSKFQLHGRLRLGFGNAAGTANETGLASAVLAVKTVGM